MRKDVIKTQVVISIISSNIYRSGEYNLGEKCKTGEIAIYFKTFNHHFNIIDINEKR